MRLFALSLATCAFSAMCLMAMFVYALNVPTRTVGYIERPSALSSTANPAFHQSSWPERWAAANLQTGK